MKERAVSVSINSYTRILGTILALILMIYLLGRQDWGEIFNTVARIETWRFVLAVGLMFLSRLFYIARWYSLLRSSDVLIKFSGSARITFAGLFANNFLPTTVGGDVVRLAGTIQEGHDGAISAASLLMDRVVGMVGMSFILPFGVLPILQANPQTGFSESRYASGLASGSWVSRLWQRGISLLRRLLGAIAMWRRRPEGLLIALFFTCMHIIVIIVFFSILLQGMGESVAPLTIGGLWSVVYFITLIPISINGWGIQETSFASLFVLYGGVSPESGWTIAFLFRLIMMLASLPGVAFVSALLPHARQQEKQE